MEWNLGRIVEPARAAAEVVERKGRGHPDSICDAIAEQLSRALCAAYLERFGAILHHNVDKAMLVGGRSAPRFGGGRIEEPMELILCGRASLEHAGERIPAEEIAVETGRAWFREQLPEVDPMAHLQIVPRLRAGSGELCALFAAGRERTPLANDTSCGVGWAPLGELEALVLGVEQYVTGSLRAEEPWIGTDVKVMGVRHRDALGLVLACALVDRHLPDAARYRERRAWLAGRVLGWLEERTRARVRLSVNVGDDDASDRYYLTVTGTSAEAGDDGQTGRGNRVNGLICPQRPMTMESVAGKNPVTHTGKLYNVCATLIAEGIVADLEEVTAAECLLVSQIGAPIDEPWLVDLRIAGADPRDAAVRERVHARVERGLAELPTLWRPLVAGEIPLDRAPLTPAGWR